MCITIKNLGDQQDLCMRVKRNGASVNHCNKIQKQYIKATAQNFFCLTCTKSRLTQKNKFGYYSQLYTLQLYNMILLKILKYLLENVCYIFNMNTF